MCEKGYSYIAPSLVPQPPRASLAACFLFSNCQPHKDTYILHTEHISIYVNAKASKSTNGWKVVKIGGLMWFTILLRSAT